MTVDPDRVVRCHRCKGYDRAGRCHMVPVPGKLPDDQGRRAVYWEHIVRCVRATERPAQLTDRPDALV